MSPDDAARVRASFARAFSAKANIAVRFYDDLFARAPQLRDAFPSDMALQHMKLSDTLAFLVRHIHRPDTMRQVFVDLSVRHVNYGTRPEYVPLVIEVLVDALRQETPGGLDEVDVAAWRSALTWVGDIMAATIEAELTVRRAAQKPRVPRLRVSGD